jgi:hypothetical protein
MLPLPSSQVGSGRFKKLLRLRDSFLFFHTGTASGRTLRSSGVFEFFEQLFELFLGHKDLNNFIDLFIRQFLARCQSASPIQ